MMAYEHDQMMESGEPLCPLSVIGGETFMMKCHKNCAWLVTVNNGKEAICGVIASECGDYMGAPTMAKNPIRIGWWASDGRSS